MTAPKSSTSPLINPSENGPYIVKGLETLTNSKGETLSTKPTIALCRCGGSANKPFCDGTHATNGFNSQKLEGRTPDRRDNYEGKEITLHDNRGICSHAGFCTSKLASVFKLKTEPWIDPDGASAEELIAAAKRCPSGALSYSIEGVEQRDQDRPPQVLVSRNGPYYVTGGIELENEARGEGASEEHYALCRCGDSKNKPFCDGTHWRVKFQDEKN